MQHRVSGYGKTGYRYEKGYDYNIPEALELSYFRFFNSPLQLIKKREFEINIKEEYEIPWKYSFNTYAFALLPVYDLKFIWASSEYGRYEKAMSEYVNGSGSFHSFLSSLERDRKSVV